MKKLILLAVLLNAFGFFASGDELPTIVVLSDVHLGLNDSTAAFSELDTFEKLVDRLLVAYQGHEKPLVVLCGDTIDHCTLMPSILAEARNEGALPPSTPDTFIDPYATWYYRLHKALQPLLDAGFRVITTVGNHDISPCERSDQFGSVFSIDGPASGLISLDDAQDEYDAAIEDYARSQGYDRDKITGVSLSDKGFALYSTWKTREHGAHPNFIAAPQYFFPTTYALDPTVFDRLVAYLGTHAAGNLPRDIVDHLGVFKRGYDIVSVCSVDASSKPSFLNHLYLQNGQYTLGISVPNQFFMHDRRIRLSSGYVDDDQLKLIQDFNGQHDQRYGITERAYNELFQRKMREKHVPENKISETWKQLPMPPEPAKILFTHHGIDYHVLRYGLNSSQALVNIVSSGFQNWANGGGQSQAMNYAILELAGRLKAVSWKDWRKMVDRFVLDGDEGVQKARALETVYGQYSANLRYGLPAYTPTDRYVYTGDEINSSEGLGTSGIINLLASRDGVIVPAPEDPPYAPGTMNGFLEALQGFDVVLTGHRHSLDVTNNKARNYSYDGFHSQVASDNALLGQLDADRSRIAQVDLYLYLKSRTYITNPWTGYEQILERLVAGLIDAFYSADLSPWPERKVQSKIVQWVFEVPSSNKHRIGNEYVSCWIELSTNNSEDKITYAVHLNDILAVPPFN